jgi:flagellar assembly factor FliW
MNSNASLAFAPRSSMIVQSDLLGPIEVSDDQLIHFPQGLLGFPECHEFVLIPAERDGLFWLQSTQYGTLIFVLVDPFAFFEGYTVDLLPADLQELHAHRPADVLILAIVTLPRARAEAPPANLQGPLAINVEDRIAKQLAISESEYGLRCVLRL